jgi:predicted Fe-Mo cluster-binding NifX family protein
MPCVRSYPSTRLAALSPPFRIGAVFLVVDGDRVEVYRNEEVIKGRGHRWEEILQLRPDVVITREIGKPAYHAFRARSVKMYFAEGTTAREASERLKRGGGAQRVPRRAGARA